jgi:hypothetical protein
MILEKLRPNGLWEPAGLGLCYQRIGDYELKLIQQNTSPQAAVAKLRLSILIHGIGWTIDETNVQMIDAEHLTMQERHMKEMEFRQEVALTWPCTNPECATPLTAFDHEKAVWIFEGKNEQRLPNSDQVEMVEHWTVQITCPVCDTVVAMEPYDFGLLAGDDSLLHYQVQNGEVKYMALNRYEIIDLIDNRASDNLIIVGTFCQFTGEMLPPHVRGSVVLFNLLGEENESVQTQEGQ